MWACVASSDLGCGVGAIAAAVRARVPGVEVYAGDIDPAAVACARRNLPEEMESPVVAKFDPAAMPILSLALSSNQQSIAARPSDGRSR